MLGFLPRMPPRWAPGTSQGKRPAPTAKETSQLQAALAAPSEPRPGIDTLAWERISSAADFEMISETAGDLVANGRVTKFLIDRRDLADPRVRFVNSNFRVGGETPPEAQFHFFFARATFGITEELPEFNAVTYFTQDKRYVAGVVHTYLLEGTTEPVYGLQFYPQDVIAEETVVDALRVVTASLEIPGARVAFVPTGEQQTVARVSAELASLGVEVLSLARILGSINYIPLNVGEAFGHLRIFPSNRDDLRPTDIVVFDELPLDLSVVAGVLTRAVQDTNSHVNLKSKERNTPNAVLRDASADHPRLAPFADEPVHLVVAKDDLLLEPTTDEIVAQKLAERLDRPLVELHSDAETKIASYDEMADGTARQAREHASRYGAKAANLAFLAHRDVLGRADDPESPSHSRGYDLVPQGFGVPLQAYRDLVDHPPNGELRTVIEALVDDEQAGRLSPTQRATRLAQVRDAFMSAEFPPGALELIHAKLDEVLPGVDKVKVRSSANVEDLPDFDGAGLHDSYSADTGKEEPQNGRCRVEEEDQATGEVKRKVKPKSVGCAVKGVYASLWNQRAVEERSFARIDQRSVAMGLAVVAAYDSESEVATNAVVVTRILNTTAVFGYSLSVQDGNNLVTNPDPGSHSEVTVAGFISDDEPVSLTVTRFAQAAADEPERTAPLLPRQQMLELVDLAKRVETAYCRAKPGYYPACRSVTSAADKETSLDLEIKILRNGRLVYKQVREFGGS